MWIWGWLLCVDNAVLQTIHYNIDKDCMLEVMDLQVIVSKVELSVFLSSLYLICL